MKIAVVVDADPVFFEGENITAYFDTTLNAHILIVNDVSERGSPKKMGAFKRWDYWHYVSE